MRDIPPSSNDFFNINDKDYIFLVPLPDSVIKGSLPDCNHQNDFNKII